MSRIRILSKRAGATPAEEDETVIDVDRTNAVLGNPFILHDHRNREERNQVITSYGQKLDDDWKINGPMRQAIEAMSKRMESGERLALRCWCSPRPCHAELIRDKIENILGLKFEINDKKYQSSKLQMKLF